MSKSFIENNVKKCQGLTNKGNKCQRRVNDNDFCNQHNYKTEECSICYTIKDLYKLNCCCHYFCKECSSKLDKCAMCRAGIKLSSKDNKKIYTCRTIIITAKELQEKSLLEAGEDIYIYNILYTGLVNEMEKIASTIYNKFYRQKFKNFFKQ